MNKNQIFTYSLEVCYVSGDTYRAYVYEYDPVDETKTVSDIYEFDLYDELSLTRMTRFLTSCLYRSGCEEISLPEKSIEGIPFSYRKATTLNTKIKKLLTKLAIGI